MDNWFNIYVIRICLFKLVAIYCSASPMMDYDVNFISINSKESILVITINGCDTKFEIKNEDLDKTKNPTLLLQFVKKAMARSRTGCT